MPTKSQATINEEKKDRDRQSNRRARMIEARVPDTHATHSAMAEALSFTIIKSVKGKTLSAEVRAFLVEWGNTALAVLAERKGYDRQASKDTVLAQIKPRKDHRWSGFVPTLFPPAEPDDI